MFKKIPNKIKPVVNERDLLNLFDEATILKEVDELDIPIKGDAGTPFFEFWAGVGYIISRSDAEFMKNALESEDLTKFILSNKSNLAKMNRLQRFINAVPELKEDERVKPWSDKINSKAFISNPEFVSIAFILALGSYGSRTRRLKNIDNPDREQSVFITWRSIRGYYDAMLEFDIEKNTVSGKDNTADIVISNDRDIIGFINKNKNKTPKYDSKTGVISIGNTKWAQISLKKGAGAAARLGKIKNFVNVKYGKVDPVEAGKELVDEFLEELNEYKPDEEIFEDEGERDILLEGFFEKLLGITKEGLSKISDMYIELSSYLKKFAKKIIEAFKNFSNRFSDASVKKVSSNISKEMNIPEDALQDLLNNPSVNIKDLQGDKLQEDWECEGRSKNDKFDQWVNSLNDKQRESFVNAVNSKVDEIVKEVKGIGGFLVSDVTHDIDPKSAKDEKGLDCQDYRQLMVNNFTMELVKEMVLGGDLKKIKVNSESIVKEFLSFKKEAIMGKTSLPIIKVFGLDPKKNISINDESELITLEKLEAISEGLLSTLQEGGYPLGGLYISSDEYRGYYVIALYGIAGIDESTGKPVYYFYEARNNSGSRFAYTVEANTLKTLEQMLTSIKGKDVIEK